MYAWKCWRDSWVVFVVVLMLEAAMVVAALLIKAPQPPNGLSIQTWQVVEVRRWMIIQSFLVYVLAIVSPIAISSSFTLTRPLARWRMAWTALGVATAQFVLIFAMVGITVVIHVSRLPVSANPSAAASLSVAAAILILLVTYFLAAEIARSSFSLLLLLLPRGKTLYSILLVFVVFVYIDFATLQPAFFPHLVRWLPELIPQVITRRGNDFILQPHLYLGLLMRCALVLGLTFLSQKRLEKREAM